MVLQEKGFLVDTTLRAHLQMAMEVEQDTDIRAAMLVVEVAAVMER